MSKEVAVKSNNEFGIDRSLWSVLSESIYPKAKPDSIKMAYDYCIQKKVDPVMKFVYIVPMYVGNQWIDTVMPGIGLYRLQADRSGKYVGKAEPEFGPIITKDLGDGDKDFSYPTWCKITVRKLIEGRIAEFTAVEYWVENYAKLKNSQVPNTMWKKRPYGQLAKCTEAQALRQAFPDHVSQGPTAEEMEGKGFEDFKDVTTSSTQILSQKLDALLTAQKAAVNTTPVSDTAVVESLPSQITEEEERATLAELIKAHNISEEFINKWFAKEEINSWEELDIERVRKYIDYINNKKGETAA